MQCYLIVMIHLHFIWRWKFFFNVIWFMNIIWFWVLLKRFEHYWIISHFHVYFCLLLKKLVKLLDSNIELSNYLAQMSITEKMFKSFFNIVETKMRVLKYSLKLLIHFASVESKLSIVQLQLGKGVVHRYKRWCINILFLPWKHTSKCIARWLEAEAKW